MDKIYFTIIMILFMRTISSLHIFQGDVTGCQYSVVHFTLSKRKEGSESPSFSTGSAVGNSF